MLKLLGYVQDQVVRLLLHVAAQRLGEFEPVRGLQSQVADLRVQIEGDVWPASVLKPGAVRINHARIGAGGARVFVHRDPIEAFDAGIRKGNERGWIVSVPPVAMFVEE